MTLEALEPVLDNGWRIFPCAERGKVPLLKNWPRSASSDMDVIRKWAEKHKACNWGVATGPESGIFAIDIDGESGEESFSSLVNEHGAWTETLAVTTARGRHFYFDWPASGTIRNSAGKLGAGIDVRGDGGYCVIPPSTHPSGASYEWATANFQTTPAIEWLLERITSAARPVLEPREFGILLDGTRNDGLTRYAGALRRKGKNQSEIEDELLAANVRRCRPPLPDADVRMIAASVARYPIGGPDPLQVAWRASEGEYNSNYERFLALCAQLQQARADQVIALPLKRIGELMGVHWNSVSLYRKKAVATGVLLPCGQYVPQRIAGTYRFTSPLVTVLREKNPSTPPTPVTSCNYGLVTVRQKPLVTVQESPLVTVAGVETSPSYSPLGSASFDSNTRAREIPAAQRCHVHDKATEWWRRADGDLVCNRCHPCPHEGQLIWGPPSFAVETRTASV
jgi:hypothetical protein